MTSIGVLGCGMVGRTWLRDIPWSRLGLEPRVYDPNHVSDVERVTEPTDLAASDTVLVFVGGSAAQGAVQSVFREDSVGPREVLDFSSNSAVGKRELGGWCAEQGASYVDVAILGAVAALGVRTPLALAGPVLSATAQTLLDASGAPVTVLQSGSPGDAARLKLVRSVVMKGLEALACEAHDIAEELQLGPAYDSVYRDVDTSGFSALLLSMVSTHEQHRERRAVEVQEALELVRSLGRSSALLEAVADNYREGPFRP
jgi:3-hydroxyisobutyrate dehydrogenase-like beta-hydroxyacid dehydrogenase